MGARGAERVVEARAVATVDGAPGVARIVDTAKVWPFFGRMGELAGQIGLLQFFAGDLAGARAIVERHLDAMAYPLSRSRSANGPRCSRRSPAADRS